MSLGKRDTKMDLLGWMPNAAVRLFFKLGLTLLALNVFAVGLCLWTDVDCTVALLGTGAAFLLTLGAWLVLRGRHGESGGTQK